jgi:hypothetical protein
MKKLIILSLLLGSFGLSIAQDNLTKTMEKRAREMHRIIGLDNKAEWKKYIQENYSQSLIDKPMRAARDNGEGTAQQSSPAKGNDALEAKTNMFQMLHQDFGNSSILSLKTEAEKAVMVLQNEQGMMGTFTLTFDKQSPYLIVGIGVEAGM